MTLEVLSSHRWCWVIPELQAVSVWSELFKLQRALRRANTRICVPSFALVQMRSRLSYRPRGRMWRQKAPAEHRPTDGGCESIVFFHTDTLAKSPHRHGRLQVFARTLTRAHTAHTLEVRASFSSSTSSTTSSLSSSSSGLLLLLLLLLLLVAASRH